MADGIVRTSGYDNPELRWPPSRSVDVANPAKKLDGVAERFIARHPDAVPTIDHVSYWPHFVQRSGSSWRSWHTLNQIHFSAVGFSTWSWYQ